MKIIDIEAITLRVPPVGEYCPWGWDSAIVKITTDEGIVGWGETDSSPALFKTLVNMPNTNNISFGLKEILLGENPLDIERLWNKMFYLTSHHGRLGVAIHAISAIDIALWDIAGKYFNVPVYQLLGGKYRDHITAYGTLVPSDDYEETAEIAQKAIQDSGFNLIKVSGGNFGSSEKFDVETTKAVRMGLGDDIGLAIDAVKQWRTYETSLSRIRKLEQFNLEWVEEPVGANDYTAYRKLSEMVSTKIAGGEALTTLKEFVDFMKYGQPAIIQPDVTNCGGLTEIKKIDIFAKQSGTRLIPHGYGTGILFATIVQFLASSEYGNLMEYAICDSPLFKYLDKNLVKSINGKIEVSNRPGLGLDIDEDIIKEFSFSY